MISNRQRIGGMVMGGIVGIGLLSWGMISMAQTASSNRGDLLALGSPAPNFALPDVVSDQTVSLDDVAGAKALLVIFLCRHCPYVQHVKSVVGQVAKDYAAQGLAVVAISANDAAAYPDDAPASLKAMAQEEGYAFPFLYDETQAVAKAYTALCTPDPFLFDARRRLVYRGQLDETRPGGRAGTGRDLRAAIEAVLAGRPVPAEQRPSVGCSIKWKPGQAPAYAQH